MTRNRGSTPEGSRWHAGERRMQVLLGVHDRMEEPGRVVLRDHMPDQHRQFFSERSQLFLATMDSNGQPWATLVEGDVGFVTSPTPRVLDIRAVLPSTDPAASGLRDGAPVGLIGIEFDTRRRNRMNGTVRMAANESGFSIEVGQSFGNCPQYIQARKPIQRGAEFVAGEPGRVVTRTALDEVMMKLLSRSDTFFIASRSASPGSAMSEGLDMSHRGGKPGFVTAVTPNRLMFPDYRGNFFFNTLGNLLTDPRCGLQFVDFASGATVQISGLGKIVSDPEVYRTWPGAERAVSVDITQAIYSETRSHLRWQFLGFAPQFS